jgi:hypothetical protein
MSDSPTTLCIAISQWGREDEKTVREAHDCQCLPTPHSRLCSVHERLLIKALTSSSGFYRRKVLRLHFENLTNEDLSAVEKAWSVKPQSSIVRSNLKTITTIIKLNQPITITALTERVNDYMGYRWSKKQIGKALSRSVKDGEVKRLTTTKTELTGQLSEVIYSLID